jgi:hydrogenase small subunit
VSSLLIGMYGRVIRRLRGLTNTTVNKEPKWRHRGHELTTGYHPTTYGNGNASSAARRPPVAAR